MKPSEGVFLQGPVYTVLSWNLQRHFFKWTSAGRVFTPFKKYHYQGLRYDRSETNMKWKIVKSTTFECWVWFGRLVFARLISTIIPGIFNLSILLLLWFSTPRQSHWSTITHGFGFSLIKRRPIKGKYVIKPCYARRLARCLLFTVKQLEQNTSFNGLQTDLAQLMCTFFFKYFMNFGFDCWPLSSYWLHEERRRMLGAENTMANIPH